jgi:hypothetical protein
MMHSPQARLSTPVPPSARHDGQPIATLGAVATAGIDTPFAADVGDVTDMRPAAEVRASAGDAFPNALQHWQLMAQAAPAQAAAAIAAWIQQQEAHDGHV